MQKKEVQSIIEALLFATPEPLTQKKVNLVFESEPPQLRNVITELNEQYEFEERAFFIDEIAGGYQIVTREEYETWIRRFLNKSGRLMLSSAALETLAIIAYKQPVSRVEIEAIRGVDSSGVIRTLLTKSLAQIRGRDTGPGRPLLYATTDHFLEHFGLGKLSEMPKLQEIKDITGTADQADDSQIKMFLDEENSESGVTI